jgi:hypothetical protein
MSNREPLEIQFPLRRNARYAVPDAEGAVRPRAGLLPRITQVLALAIHLDKMIQKGDAKDYADIARLSSLCRERGSQIMRLNCLAPDIQVELLYLPPVPAGRYPISETAMRKIANLLSWADQRRAWMALKQQHRLSE